MLFIGHQFFMDKFLDRAIVSATEATIGIGKPN